VRTLLPAFGGKLLSEIRPTDITAFQAQRKKDGVSNRTVNMAVGSLRAILRKHRLWANIQPDVKPLKVKNEIGRALSADEQQRLLTACKKSRSRSLYPAVLLSLHTGLRNKELRTLKWHQVDLLDGSVTVGESKTEAGSGRIVPLSKTALACIKDWRTLFPAAKPTHYVFPSEKYASKNDPKTGLTTSESIAYDTDPGRPILSWKSGWTVARKSAGVSCRWHDLRHSFISTMAEGQASDATIMSMSGHVSQKLLERYSHTRNEAKRRAIAALDRSPYPQNPPQ
jgi:integrase